MGTKMGCWMLLVLLALTSCATFTAIRSGGNKEAILTAAKLDAARWGSAACSEAPEADKVKLRATVPALAMLVRQGKTAELRKYLFERGVGSLGVVNATTWWAISAAMSVFGSSTDWLANFDEVAGVVITSCDAALGTGSA